jgi:hypothetical protein
MDFTGRPMNGFLYVNRDVCETDADLSSWLHEALGFVETLLPKSGSKPSKAKSKR